MIDIILNKETLNQENQQQILNQENQQQILKAKIQQKTEKNPQQEKMEKGENQVNQKFQKYFHQDIVIQNSLKDMKILIL